jgi:hypothetical protein
LTPEDGWVGWMLDDVKMMIDDHGDDDSISDLQISNFKNYKKRATVCQLFC